ncbi:MAG TPA: alpha-L-arabinofuranosidase C-terminal domain-containing protein [Verrucomicrobiae bacterium]|nr:alpha-L-arabinofuranosidase C-terminal domain-containing protein [Verrucomicrobiae bacterium]
MKIINNCLGGRIAHNISGWIFSLSRPSKTAGLFASLITLVTALAHGQSAAIVTIDASRPGAIVSTNLFGIFFEEINYAGDGGIYGEMVRNRSFAESSNPDYWTLVTSGTATGTMSVDSTQPLNTNIVSSLKLTLSSGSGSVGVANSGYWGMSISNGATYNLSFYAAAPTGFSGSLTAQLRNSSGTIVYAQTAFGGLNGNWQKFSASLVSSGTDTNAQLVISISQPGSVWLGMVSLFPQATFHNRTNGLRADIANMLDALHPSFMRYPGGNFIESDTMANAVRWKKTIGDISERPGHQNDAWGYWSTDGYGFDEYAQQCEDMGMRLLYGINAGLALGYNGSTNNTVPLDQMGPWVQDALDLIQYANGDTNTTWGALRAANGHPAPYDLQYMEIGNENGGSYYNDRYALFYDAIKSNYPSMHLITPNWGGIPTSRPVEIEDEHYYSSPGTFISYATKYDNYNRSGPKVFVGEYAVTSGFGTYGNLSAALGEAAFMTGMERNSDIVQLASYAPLFANVNGIQWHPDLIYYNSSQVFGTPSYYVQKMFSNNRGDYVLPTAIQVDSSAPAPPPHGAIGVGSWNTSVQYTNIVVTSNGVVIYQSDFVNQGTNGWRVYKGSWSTNAGLYQQTSASTTDCRSTTGDTNWANYTISLRARKASGSEGFLILFNWSDDNNWTWWNVGGWGNTLDGVEQMSGGTKAVLGQVSQTAIATGTWYDISIVVSNYTVQCYLDGSLVQTVNYSTNSTSGLYASTTFNKSSGQVIVKAVNPYSTPLITTMNLTGVNSISPDADVVQLTSGSPSDENSFAAPTHVSPVTNHISNAGTNFTLTLPANSLSIIKLTADGMNNYTNLSLQLPPVITNGFAVSSTVWGQQLGNWFNLTTNSNHAITWTSLNTNIAVVDISGRVTGVHSGTATIIASYPALGLSATQTVQVIYTPVTLEHRYSFSETSGTNVADSIGGAAWDGILPNGGTFNDGQVQLLGASSQYIQLPANILSNYTAVTIELWATFPTTLPSACFLFGFGNINGSSGLNYIFCQPKNGRIAITDSNYSGEQNTAPSPSGDWSGRTNLHVVAVFNPPLGQLMLYTNGILAAQNSSITIPMSSVNDLLNFIGRSLYSGDSYFDCNLDEFRIYNGALSPAEIAASGALGPDQLLSDANPTISPSLPAPGNLRISWPLNAAGFYVLSTTNLASGNWIYTELTPQIAGGEWQVAVPVTNAAQFYRLGK